MLDGREYGKEITISECKLAAEDNIVIVFGYSDDCMEFRGAIHDEVSCYDGGVAYIYSAGGFRGLLVNCCDSEDCPYFKDRVKASRTIEAIWDNAPSAPQWRYETNIPHKVFAILEDGELYCCGIVFSLDNLGEKNGFSN